MSRHREPICSRLRDYASFWLIWLLDPGLRLAHQDPLYEAIFTCTGNPVRTVATQVHWGQNPYSNCNSSWKFWIFNIKPPLSLPCRKWAVIDRLNTYLAVDHEAKVGSAASYRERTQYFRNTLYQLFVRSLWVRTRMTAPTKGSPWRTHSGSSQRRSLARGSMFCPGRMSFVGSFHSWWQAVLWYS